MTRIYRAMVYLVTFAVPVVIAACYGPAYRYRKGGKVLDRATRDPISKIDVSCDLAVGTSKVSPSGSSGDYSIQTDEPCVTIRAVDSLGPLDAGTLTPDGGAPDAGSPERTARYSTKTIPVTSNDDLQHIEMDRSN